MFNGEKLYKIRTTISKLFDHLPIINRFKHYTLSWVNHLCAVERNYFRMDDAAGVVVTKITSQKLRVKIVQGAMTLIAIAIEDEQ